MKHEKIVPVVEYARCSDGKQGEEEVKDEPVAVVASIFAVHLVHDHHLPRQASLPTMAPNGQDNMSGKLCALSVLPASAERRDCTLISRTSNSKPQFRAPSCNVEQPPCEPEQVVEADVAALAHTPPGLAVTGINTIIANLSVSPTKFIGGLLCS